MLPWLVLVINSPTVIPPANTLPPAAIILSPLLLTENCPITGLPDPSNLAPEMLNLRAKLITVVLMDILEETGYPHGGINE